MPNDELYKIEIVSNDSSYQKNRGYTEQYLRETAVDAQRSEALLPLDKPLTLVKGIIISGASDALSSTASSAPHFESIVSEEYPVIFPGNELLATVTANFRVRDFVPSTTAAYWYSEFKLRVNGSSAANPTLIWNYAYDATGTSSNQWDFTGSVTGIISKNDTHRLDAGQGVIELVWTVAAGNFTPTATFELYNIAVMIYRVDNNPLIDITESSSGFSVLT